MRGVHLGPVVVGASDVPRGAGRLALLAGRPRAGRRPSPDHSHHALQWPVWLLARRDRGSLLGGIRPDPHLGACDGLGQRLGR